MTYTQPPLFPPPADWRPPALSALPSWAEAKRVAVDIETYDPQLNDMGPGVRRGGHIIGVSFAIEDGPAAYLPTRHLGGDNLDEAQVLAYLRDQAAVFKGDLCGANLQYDLDYLEEAGVHFTLRFFRDVQVAEPLLDENQFTYSLEDIAERHGLPAKDEHLLRFAAQVYGIHPKKEMWKLPARYIGAYAEQDARLPLALLRRQEKLIDEQNLWGVYDLESKVLPILLKMRRWGVRIDLRRLDEVEAFLIAEEHKAIEQIRVCTGRTLSFEDVPKAAPVAPIFEALGYKIPLTDGRKMKDGSLKREPSIDLDFLKTVKEPVARHLERARKLNKVRRDFVRTIREHLIGDRVHCTFNQLKSVKSDDDPKGTITGRLSSSDFNIQQQPARDPELGPLWRSIYVPDEGQLWASADYSAQEPRMTVHYAAVAGCRGAAEMVAKYQANPKLDLHMATADLCYPDMADRKKARGNSKEIFLGLAYGMGGGKLCIKLRLPTEMKFSKRLKKNILVAGPEGQVLIDKYHAMVPFVKELTEKVQLTASNKGFIRTLSGRRLHFPLTEDSNDRYRQFDGLNKALNKLIQGSSADQTKMGMVALDAAGLCPQLQVHDEVDRSVRSREEGQEMARIMETAVVLRVPTISDLKVEANWGLCKG